MRNIINFKNEYEILYFVRHKLGVRGKSVYPITDINEIRRVFKENQHIIQREVEPFLINERKFVIRAHVL